LSAGSIQVGQVLWVFAFSPAQFNHSPSAPSASANPRGERLSIQFLKHISVFLYTPTSVSNQSALEFAVHRSADWRSPFGWLMGRVDGRCRNICETNRGNVVLLQNRCGECLTIQFLNSFPVLSYDPSFQLDIIDHRKTA
jgi:hypothetical protein